MFLPGCDAILDSSIWGHARYVYVSNLCLLYLWLASSKNLKTWRNSSRNSFPKNWMYSQGIYTYFVFLLTFYSWCWFCTPEWYFCRSLLSKRLWNLFLCYRRHEQFVLPVTGCSACHDFEALRCQAGQQALALGHLQVVDDRGLIHSQLDQKNWCYNVIAKCSAYNLAEQGNGIFSNLTVSFQGTCDDGIQLNMTINWKDRLELAEVIVFQAWELSDLFKYTSC